MEYEFTWHAEERLHNRGILKIEIIEGLKNPVKVSKKEGFYYVLIDLGRGKVEVVYEKEANFIKIITFYWM
ncbi:DUF4258 domain-containing protein [Candidatus Woesearchaeota archaeon]|nr:DUF4258 domain-containing protein [Candidatus Woesearchaeota archaeon]